MRPYEERRAARIERLRARAVARNGEADAAWKAMDRIASVIPLGQPILVGHHSERRHRRDIKRMDQSMRRSVEARKDAADLERRADAAEQNTAIFTDDPEALVKLRAKLADEGRGHELHKKDVALARKALRGLDLRTQHAEADEAMRKAGVSDRLRSLTLLCGFLGGVTNGSANIRRIKQRIAELEAKAVAPLPEPETYGDVRIEESDNRVRIYFPGKPDDAVRTELKSWGFRWSPSEGAWQRHASPGAWHWARVIVKKATEAA